MTVAPCATARTTERAQDKPTQEKGRRLTFGSLLAQDGDSTDSISPSFVVHLGPDGHNNIIDAHAGRH